MKIYCTVLTIGGHDSHEAQKIMDLRQDYNSADEAYDLLKRAKEISGYDLFSEESVTAYAISADEATSKLSHKVSCFPLGKHNVLKVAFFKKKGLLNKIFGGPIGKVFLCEVEIEE